MSAAKNDKILTQELTVVLYDGPLLKLTTISLF